MGISYHNCDGCGDIYADCDDISYCEGCNGGFCYNCNQRRLKKFVYHGKCRCNFCFDTDPRPITDEQVLAFALQQLGKTKEELKSEMKQEPGDVYVCLCGNSTCERLGQDYYPDELSCEDENIDAVRGVCCKDRENEEVFCGTCSQSFKKIKVGDSSV
jgi:hypothetical protein